MDGTSSYQLTSHRVDPVENGLAVSLAQPGGNVTSMSILSAEGRQQPPTGWEGDDARAVQDIGRSPGQAFEVKPRHVESRVGLWDSA